MASLTLSVPTFYTYGSGWTTSLNGKCVITATRDSGNSYVDVTAKWTIKSPGGMTASVKAYLTVGSTSKTVTFSGTKYAGSSYSKSTSFTVSVGDSAGTLTCKAYLYVNDSSATSGKTSSKVSGTISYDSRGVSIFKSIPTFTLGSSGTIKVTRYVSSYTHTIKCTIGSNTTTVCTKSSSTSVSWTPSLSLAKYITSATSATATYKITTYSGSTKIGDTQSGTGTIKVPSSVVPTVSSITLSDVGSHPFTGLWVKGLSKVKAVISATTAYSSSIKTYKFAIDSLTASGSSSTLTFSSTLSSSGTVTGTATITDARGRTGTGTKAITVYNYYAPTIDLDIGIDDTTLSIGYTWSVADVNNTNTYALSIKVVKTSTGSTVGTYTPTLDGYTGTGTLELTLDDLQYETYTVTATLTDKVQSVSTTANSGQVALSFRAGGLRAAFFGQAGKQSGLNYDNCVQILGNPEGEGSIGLSVVDPDTGLYVSPHIGAGRKNHGVWSGGYVTDDDLANHTFTYDSLWEIYRNSSGNITIGDSSHSCYAPGGFVSGGHNSVIGSQLSVTSTSVSSVSSGTATSLQSLTIPAGTWIIVATANFTISTAQKICNYISTSVGTSQFGNYHYATTSDVRVHAVRTAVQSSSLTLYNVAYAASGATVDSATMYAIRIA